MFLTGTCASALLQHRHDFKFRSYDPATGQARKHDKAVDEAETVEQATAGLVLQAIREDEQRRKEELDLFNIQPKKPNWDLKRDLEKRLEKVRPKTEAAINTLIRKFLSAHAARKVQLIRHCSCSTGRRLGVAQKGTKETVASQGGEDVAEAVSRRRIEDEEALSDEDEV